MADLYTVETSNGPPSLAEAAAALHRPVGDLDASYGVIAIDPRRGLYTVRAKTAAEPHPQMEPEASGPFSDPQIAPFGPPR